jgi:hypothetical protein
VVFLCAVAACSRAPSPTDHATSTTVASATPMVPPPPSASAAPEQLAEYEGPAGLRWGQSPAEAKTVLSAKYTFRREDSADKGQVLEQTWAGEFAGFKTESIAVDFFDKKRFVAFGATLPAKDVRPAARRWLDLVETTTKVHGAPSRFTPPPELQSARKIADNYPDLPNKERLQQLASQIDAFQETAGTSGFDALDRKIARGDWEPVALWKFKGDTAILIKVEVGEPDSHGGRSLKPVWLAMSGEKLEWKNQPKSEL